MASSNPNQSVPPTAPPPPPPPPDATKATSSTTKPTPHTNILHQAKQTQQQDLKQSATYIKQLHTITNLLISSNSNPDPLTTKSNLLDKITTIHQLNDSIDHQLNDEISRNFYNMMKMKRKVMKLNSSCMRKFDSMNETVHVADRGSEVSLEDDVIHDQQASNGNGKSEVARLSLQKRCELIDQDLRILEHTLKLINERS
ncbi:hypothetical protein I9W82_005017 [Candida metapsilosis]|uniref:Uncharacterized protein n=1 Tax=Candida metapsilosis TaxID=273372 RepID=A0A8H7ZBD1_9ASCO|nr:hypothetical protein I9W82_005017 [Candida metapsilosis]